MLNKVLVIRLDSAQGFISNAAVEEPEVADMTEKSSKQKMPIANC